MQTLPFLALLGQEVTPIFCVSLMLYTTLQGSDLDWTSDAPQLLLTGSGGDRESQSETERGDRETDRQTDRHGGDLPDSQGIQGCNVNFGAAAGLNTLRKLVCGD